MLKRFRGEVRTCLHYTYDCVLVRSVIFWKCCDGLVKQSLWLLTFAHWVTALKYHIYQAMTFYWVISGAAASQEVKQVAGCSTRLWTVSRPGECNIITDNLLIVIDLETHFTPPPLSSTNRVVPRKLKQFTSWNENPTAVLQICL